MITLRSITLCFFMTASVSSAHAHESLTPEPSEIAYNFVTHYRVAIQAPPEVVWKHLIDLKSWMYEFDLSTETGLPGAPGQILNLYEGQDFKIQITAADPNRLLAIANLPVTFQGEYGTGVGIFTLHELQDSTELSLTASRRYSWSMEGPNHLRERRATESFQLQTRDTWQRFLERLKRLAEQTAEAN